MLVSFIIRLVLNAMALLAIAYFVPGFKVTGFYSALMVALILGLINAVIKPVLVILTLPITLVTLGLFVFVINIFLLWFVSTIVKGFTIETLTAAVIGWLLYSVFGLIFSKVLR